MKLIDKDVLVAEIERIKKEECPIDSYEGRCKLLWFEQFLSFLDTLKVKEVDLEKEKDDYWNKLCDSEFGESLERAAKWFDYIAEHLFESIERRINYETRR